MSINPVTFPFITESTNTLLADSLTRQGASLSVEKATEMWIQSLAKHLTPISLNLTHCCGHNWRGFPTHYSNSCWSCFASHTPPAPAGTSLLTLRLLVRFKAECLVNASSYISDWHPFMAHTSHFSKNNYSSAVSWMTKLKEKWTWRCFPSNCVKHQTNITASHSQTEKNPDWNLYHLNGKCSLAETKPSLVTSASAQLIMWLSPYVENYCG